MMISTTIANTALTIACIVVLVVLGLTIAAMWKAIRRDLKQGDDERKRELRDWDDE